MGSESRTLNVVVVGGGLVGALIACFLAKRGHRVRLYEYRSDIRIASSRGVSIDLSLSIRGREALRAIGLEDTVLKHYGIAMKGRMIHLKDGTLKSISYDSVNKKCIYSVNRSNLNKLLLSSAEKYPNVTLHFNHKLIDADIDKGILKILNVQTQETFETEADLIVGADGAYSRIRRLMARKPRFNYNQSYIDHGYVEVSFPSTKDGNFIMSGKHLHIWPRGDFMMLAMPNEDRSFTGNIFAPFKSFEALDTPERLVQFFKEQFPDAIPLIGEKKMINDFFQTSAKTLISIKCKPYHVGSKTLIIGDSAHAMVPFYAQGMNSGFEDVLLFDHLMEIYDSDLEKVLPRYSELRCDDCHAICDLAMYNYLEMRDLVTRKSFLFRKYVDTTLNWLFPNKWIPLYHTVTFSRMRYSECISNKAWQDKVLKTVAFSAGTAVLAAITAVSVVNAY